MSQPSVKRYARKDRFEGYSKQWKLTALDQVTTNFPTPFPWLTFESMTECIATKVCKTNIYGNFDKAKDHYCENSKIRTIPFMGSI